MDSLPKVKLVSQSHFAILVFSRQTSIFNEMVRYIYIHDPSALVDATICQRPKKKKIYFRKTWSWPSWPIHVVADMPWHAPIHVVAVETFFFLFFFLIVAVETWESCFVANFYFVITKTNLLTCSYSID
jgi:hypothetical protein